MGSRLIPVVLLALLALIHVQLWSGRGSIPDVAEMRSRLDAQRAANAQARQANDRLQAEVRDLQEGMEMVEDKARGELGMVRPGEVFVQITK